MAEQPEQPKKIGRFPIIGTLGVGGMGVVYLGKDPDIGRKVAIKVLHITGDKEALERFKNEARTMGEISHPNIVILLEYGIDDNKPFLVMEYLDGLSLEKWINQPHTLEQHKKVLLNLCSAISFAHRKEILHRDLKPGNVQVLPSGDAKLLDFGIATGEDTGLTATGFFIGTPKYLAPEILQDTTHTKSSDSYSLGLLAYTMLSGNNPFATDTFEATMTRLLTKIPVSLHKINPNIPSELSSVVDKYLDKNPEHRPNSPKELQMALELITKPSVLKKTIVPNADSKDLRSQEKTVLIGEKPKSKVKWLAIVSLFVVLGVSGIVYKNYLEKQKEQEIAKIELANKQRIEQERIKQELARKEQAIKEAFAQRKEMERVKAQKEQESLATEKIAEKEAKQKPIRKKPKIKPVNKPVVEEEYKPPVIVYQESKKKTNKNPVVRLPTLRPNAKRVELKTRSDTQISRGTTKSITLEIPSGIVIDDFKVMQGISEFNQVEIRKIKKLQDNSVKITLYAQSNAAMEYFELVGYYQKKKTKPLRMEVTL
jgi:serine/threonine protein kinase